MKIITINSKKYGTKEILVDDEDYDFLMQWKWTIHKSARTFYAKRNFKIRGKAKVLPIQRAIMGSICYINSIDHIDRNGLNNQKQNLRECSHFNNSKNRSSYINSSSKYLGVCKITRIGAKNNVYTYWIARIFVSNKNINLGLYKKETDAALAYNKAAEVHYKEFANLNIIE